MTFPRNLRSNDEVLPTSIPLSIMADQNPPSSRSIYPLPPGDSGYDGGYRYEDAAQAAAAAAAQSQEPSGQIQQTGYEEHRALPSPVQQTPTKSRNGGEVKPRLRKACDSCSVRKVKVLVLNVPSSWTQMLTARSATRVDHPASPVPAWTFPVHSIDPVAEEDLRTDTLKRSKDSGSKMDHTIPWLLLKWLHHLQEMLLLVLRHWDQLLQLQSLRCRYQPTRSAISQPSAC